ncbi:hypothetical protein E4U15_004337, partial [Claviceps sp. LM218 group G6]
MAQNGRDFVRNYTIPSATGITAQNEWNRAADRLQTPSKKALHSTPPAHRLLGQYISFHGSKSTNIQAMLSRVFQRRLTPSSLRICRPQLSSAYIRATAPQRRWITPAPQSGDGPLMSRRTDRELP